MNYNVEIRQTEHRISQLKLYIHNTVWVTLILNYNVEISQTEHRISQLKLCIHNTVWVTPKRFAYSHDDDNNNNCKNNKDDDDDDLYQYRVVNVIWVVRKCDQQKLLNLMTSTGTVQPAW